MARMSIDDKIGRDPRITMLAHHLGWSKRELVGCLILDVWPLCYDQESALVSERIIDAAAGHQGFGLAMVEYELATRDRSGKLRIKGAAERIAYLDHQRRAGREGGLKSAASRAKDPKGGPRPGGASLKQPSSDGQGSGNPSAPDTVPDSASASASAPDGVTAPDGVVEKPPEKPGKSTTDVVERKKRLPADWSPSRSQLNLEAEQEAARRGVDLRDELRKMRDWALANSEKKIDWDATWRNWTRNAKPRSTQASMSGLDYAKAVASGELP